MSFQKPFELQRLRYWQGQLLRSQDLRDQVGMAAHFRWWHNRAIHNTYGIARGLEVTPESDVPPPPSLMIAPGLAYDCYGRELMLQEPATVTVPAHIPNAGMTLLARYQEDEAFQNGNEVACPWLFDSSHRTAERPSFGWQPGSSASIRDGVPLARLDRDGRLDVSFGLQQARALARPRVANGSTIAGNTAWQAWRMEAGPETTLLLGLEVEIDTSAAGFTVTPCYFAWLQGALWDEKLMQRLSARTKKSALQATSQITLQQLQLLQLLALRLDHISTPTQTAFTFRLWLPQLAKTAGQEGAAQLLALAQEQKLSVCWVGIQPAGHLHEVTNGTA